LSYASTSPKDGKSTREDSQRLRQCQALDPRAGQRKSAQFEEAAGGRD